MSVSKKLFPQLQGAPLHNCELFHWGKRYSITGAHMTSTVWKQRKNIWYIVELENEKNVLDVLTPLQFNEAIQNKKYSLKSN